MNAAARPAVIESILHGQGGWKEIGAGLEAAARVYAKPVRT